MGQIIDEPTNAITPSKRKRYIGPILPYPPYQGLCRHDIKYQLQECMMKESIKVQPHHLERSAYLYVRQSSPKQVLENVESGKRQYALRTRAVALGWRDEQIIVIDSDQGESGASATWRGGFQHLVSEIGMGRAGIVMGLR